MNLVGELILEIYGLVGHGVAEKGRLAQSCPWVGLTHGFGLVGLGRVGSGHTKWTHGQLWVGVGPMLLMAFYKTFYLLTDLTLV